ncbi:MAG: hypothetical protein Q9219_007643 [cf. Caloplaca sp. 3 TL-2023]
MSHNNQRRRRADNGSHASGSSSRPPPPSGQNEQGIRIVSDLDYDLLRLGNNPSVNPNRGTNTPNLTHGSLSYIHLDNCPPRTGSCVRNDEYDNYYSVQGFPPPGQEHYPGFRPLPVALNRPTDPDIQIAHVRHFLQGVPEMQELIMMPDRRVAYQRLLNAYRQYHTRLTPAQCDDEVRALFDMEEERRDRVEALRRQSGFYNA